MLTGRDAAHKRIQTLLESGEGLPAGLDFKNKFIYYVGPVDAVRDEAVGPAGPTTSTRMDKFTEMMLAETGLLGMVGKAERGPTGIDAIKKHSAVYLMAVGGAAYLVSKAVKRRVWSLSKSLVWRLCTNLSLKICQSPWLWTRLVISIHQTGPALWKGKLKAVK